MNITFVYVQVSQNTYQVPCLKHQTTMIQSWCQQASYYLYVIELLVTKSNEIPANTDVPTSYLAGDPCRSDS